MAENERKLLLSISDKITKGLPLAIHRMLQEAKQTNRELAVVRNGKMILVKTNEYKG